MSSIKRIFVIGSCGKSVFMTVDHFHAKGETLIANGIAEELGGKGFNQAIAAARMGAQVHFLAAVGDDAPAIACEDQLKACGIQYHLIEKKGKRTPIAFILTDQHGENQVTVYQTAELVPEDVEAFASQIAASDILLLQQEVPVEVNAAAIAIAAEHHVKVILNPAPARPIDAATAAGVYLITPNEQEAEAVDASRFANVITTLGSRGCSINGRTVIPALPVKPTDTTGAGDTFNGVLAVRLAEGASFEDACRWAVTASGISVTRRYVVDAIPTRAEIAQKLHTITL